VTETFDADSGSGDVDDPNLQEMIDHWVSVIDQWVRKFDRETGGGRADGAGPAGESSSLTDPAPEAQPG